MGDRDFHDFIEDQDLYMAVGMARWLIREKNMRPGLAMFRAAKRWGVRACDVAHYVGQHAGRTQSLRRKT